MRNKGAEGQRIFSAQPSSPFRLRPHYDEGWALRFRLEVGNMDMANDQDVKRVNEDGKVDVTVNGKPVVLDGTSQTGVSIKKAAIEQGVNIKADFVLSIELDGGKTELIGDEQKIESYSDERFLAIENDDNS